MAERPILAKRGDNEVRRITREEIASDAVLGTVLQIWETKRGDKFAPHPSEMDAFALPPAVLPRVLLVDVFDGGARFRFRLIGSAVVLSVGVDLTGQYIDEAISGAARDATDDHYRTVVRSRRPACAISTYRLPAGETIKNSYLAVPLSLDGEAVDRLLVASHVTSDWLFRGDSKNLERARGHEAARGFIVL